MADLNTISGLHYEMMRRCYNENSVCYSTYGGAGIKVCEQWHDREQFKKWCIENGWQKGLRLQRIDSTKDYEPSNCRFGTGYVRTQKCVDKKRNRQIKEHLCNEFTLVKDDKYYALQEILHTMKTRCYNPNSENYCNYGGRGIKICDLWMGKYGFFFFYRWAMTNGFELGLSIDRIDVNGDYSQFNCRWATMKEQANNKRNTRHYIYKRESITTNELCEIFGVNRDFVYRYIKDGMSIDKILNRDFSELNVLFKNPLGLCAEKKRESIYSKLTKNM